MMMKRIEVGVNHESRKKKGETVLEHENFPRVPFDSIALQGVVVACWEH